jgi:cobyrinic acid a,c-diamide synthase
MWLARASGRDCHNLDFQTMSDDEILAYLKHYSADADVAIIEGNKGLYDGVALDGSNSNAAVAELTKTPVILVIDTQGMTRGIAPLLLGYQAFNKNITIAGVILNKVGGPRHEQKLRDVIAEFTSITVIGAVPRVKDLDITERHLGLVPSNEATNTESIISKIAQVIEEHVDLDLFIAKAATAPDLPESSLQLNTAHKPVSLKVGIAKDAAFGFYYPGDLNAFRAEGVELVEFDTIKDSRLPAVDALFIGGGFPESWMKELAANTTLRHDIKAAIEAGMPAYAECGGLMYLCNSISWHNKKYEMVGLLDATIHMNEKPLGRGYVALKQTSNHPWATMAPKENHEILAHEFHYSGLDNLKTPVKYAYEMRRGSGINGVNDGLVYKNLLANYAHLRDTSQHHWVSQFVNFIRQVKS